MDVSYSCGTCGYPLKLCSSNRASLSMGSDYHRETKKGTISFLSIDESRFKQLDELTCGLYCESPTTWRLHRLRTKLLCGQCEAVIGHVYEEGGPSLIGCTGFDSSSENGTPGQKRFWVKIRALQPEQDPGDSPSVLGEKGSRELAPLIFEWFKHSLHVVTRFVSSFVLSNGEITLVLVSKS